MYVENRTKSPIFTPPVYLTPPMKGLPLEFGIGVRGPECFYDGAIRSKKFSDTFSRFDTIPAVTDSHPPSHPASHVAVAITLNAKASSLKTIKSSMPVWEITSKHWKHIHWLTWVINQIWNWNQACKSKPASHSMCVYCCLAVNPWEYICCALFNLKQYTLYKY